MKNLRIYDEKIEIISKFREKTKEIKLEDIEQIEERFGLFLPDEYVVFLINFGKKKNIDKLIKNIESVIADDNIHLKKSIFYDKKKYKNFYSRVSKNRFDEEELTDMLLGTLEIAHFGCTFFLHLILNGVHTGKVLDFSYDCMDVNLKSDWNKLELLGFLDWYIKTDNSFRKYI